MKAASAILTLAAGLSGIICAQTIGSPSLGIIFDVKSGVIRNLEGVPGAAQEGAEIDFGVPFSRAFVSPSQTYILAEIAGSPVMMLGKIADPGGLQPFLTVSAGAELLAFSPAGKSVALYYRESRRFLIIDGLPDSPKVRSDVSGQTVPGLVTAIAVRDAGDLLLAGSVDGANGHLLLVKASGDQQYVRDAGYPTSMVFGGDGSKVIVADTARGKTTLISGLGDANTAAEFPIAGNLLSLSNNDRKVVIADTGSGVITALDLNTGSARSVACRCHPSSLQQLSGRTVLGLIDSTSPQIHIFEESADSSRVTVVANQRGLSGRKSREQPLSSPSEPHE